MTHEEAKKMGATHYYNEEYFDTDYWKKENNIFYLWDGEKWSIYPYQHYKSLTLIKPL